MNERKESRKYAEGEQQRQNENGAHEESIAASIVQQSTVGIRKYAKRRDVP
jgi:hypothetical protein